MDDYSIQSLSESKNELCARLVNILTPLVLEGYESIFNESWNVCNDNDELDKYLMTFQNFVSRVPKWNGTIIENETNRIIEKSGCTYLEDLITCVHVVHLKALTCMRVGQKQKKVDIDIPSLSTFIHNVYIQVARKVYTNVYLYEKNIMPLQIQKHKRELEVIVKECIMNTIRESIPVEKVLRAYMDETEEQDVEVEEKEEVIPVEVEKEVPVEVENPTKPPDVVENQPPNVSMVITDLEDDTNDSLFDSNERRQSIGFNNTDSVMNENGLEEKVSAPKNISRLEEISRMNNERRKLEEEAYDDESDDEGDSLNIGSDIKLDTLEVEDLVPKKSITNSSHSITLNTEPLLTDIEVLH
jgi:hypothetical protein